MMRSRTKPALLAAVIFALLLASCGGGGTESVDDGATADGDPPAGSADREFNLQMATYTGPQAADNIAYEWWAERVNELTEGTVSIEILRQGSLLPAPEILPGVAAGRADLGGTSYIYHPAELPLSHIVNIPYQTDNMPAESRAFFELYQESEAYQAEFAVQGVHLLFNWIVGPPLFGCSEPVESLSDLEGRDVRVGGLVANAWEPIGVNIVSIPATEIRESMERGLLDCWAGIPLDIIPDFGLAEVTPYIYDHGYENYGTFHLVVNQAVWDALSPSQQDAMSMASEEVLSQLEEITDEAYSKACAAVQESADFTVLPVEIQEEWKQLVGDSVIEAFYELADGAGVDGRAFFQEYQSAVENAEAEFPDYESAVTRCAEGEL